MTADAIDDSEPDDRDRRTRWANFPDGPQHLDHSTCTTCKQVIRQHEPGAPWLHTGLCTTHYAERDSTHMWTTEPRPTPDDGLSVTETRTLSVCDNCGMNIARVNNDNWYHTGTWQTICTDTRTGCCATPKRPAPEPAAPICQHCGRAIRMSPYDDRWYHLNGWTPCNRDPQSGYSAEPAADLAVYAATYTLTNVTTETGPIPDLGHPEPYKIDGKWVAPTTDLEDRIADQHTALEQLSALIRSQQLAIDAAMRRIEQVSRRLDNLVADNSDPF